MSNGATLQKRLNLQKKFAQTLLYYSISKIGLHVTTLDIY